MEAEDPFGSLIKLCLPTASQEKKLRKCPFARQSEKYSDPDPNWLTSSLQSWTSSEPTEVMMVSPPDSGDSIDRNTPPEEDDKYHTPPEHSLSLASDSDDPKKPRPPPGTTVCGGDDDQRVAVDLGKEGEEENLGFPLDRILEGIEKSLRGKQASPLPSLPPATTVCGGDIDGKIVKSAVDMGDGEGKLGLQLDKKLEGLDGNVKGKQPPTPPLGTVRGGDDDLKVERAVVDIGDKEENLGFLESPSNRNLNGECCDCVVRDHKLEVLEGESEKNRVLDGEFCKNVLKKIRVCEANLGLGMDTVCCDETQRAENLDTEIIHLDSEECDGELGVDEQRVVINVEESMKVGRVSKGINLHGNGEDRAGASIGEKLFQVGEDGGGDGEAENLHMKSENLRENGKEGGRTREGRNFCENGQGSDGIRAKRLRRNGEEGGELRKDNSNRSGNGDGVSCEAENLGNSSQRALRKALEVIEKFKYVGSGDGMERRGKKRGVPGKSELPLSRTGQGKAVLKEAAGGNEKMKSGSFMDFLDSLKLVLGGTDDGSEHDFLETAKKRGMVFPRPRWWPPEGLD